MMVSRLYIRTTRVLKEMLSTVDSKMHRSALNCAQNKIKLWNCFIYGFVLFVDLLHKDQQGNQNVSVSAS